MLPTGKIKGLEGIVAIVLASAVLAGCDNSSSSDSSTAVTSASATSGTNGIGASAATGEALVALSSAQYQVAPASSAIVTIYRSGSPSGKATVSYSTVNGTALAGKDYTATQGYVTWQDGDTAARTVIVPTGASANGKAFGISLTSIQGPAGFGSPAAATIAVSSAASNASNTTGSSSAGSSTGSTTSSNSGSSSSSGGTSSSSASASTGTKTATLSWSAPTENTNGTAITDLAGYNIYYGTSTSSMTNKIAINTVGMLTYVIDNMASGNWYFAITSVNSAGMESVLSSTVGTTL